MNALILATDGLDIDVYKNIKYFYEACGYEIHLKATKLKQIDIIVYLRGEISTPDFNYTGIVHIYDYVKNVQNNWVKIFPNASKIFLISLNTSQDNYKTKEITCIEAFLPIIPVLWVNRNSKKKLIPIHISHYKKGIINKYQDELVKLAEGKHIKIYGKRWELNNIIVKSISLSESNKKFRDSLFCFGLMYDYQIGNTLSGRMWQAPLNGCYVFTELGSNVLNCPGVIEVDSYLKTIEQIKSEKYSKLNVNDVTRFWNNHTSFIANELGLNYLEKSRLKKLIYNIKFKIFIIKNNIIEIILKKK